MTKITIDRSTVEFALEALEGVATALREEDVLGRDIELLLDASTNLRSALAQPVQEPASKMTAGRAAYFMARFKREEKMLGPNEQAALDFVISMLEAALAEPVQEPVKPVAWMLPGSDSIITAETKAYRGVLAENWTLPLYTAPPQRKPLTEGKPWVCACGANLYIDADGKPRSKA